MPDKDIDGKTITVDDDGHMTDIDQWDEDVAKGLAADMELELTDEHWKVINFIRDEYKKSGTTATLRKIGKQSGVDIKGLYQLFPEKPLRKSSTLAGLPKPKSCV